MRPDTEGSQPTVLERISTMRRTLACLVMAAAITLVGCNLDLTNPNNPTLKGCLSNTRACTSRMIAGVMATYRSTRTDQIRALGSFGRETYYMFITDGRFITGPLRDWKQNNAFDAGTQWGARYQNYHNAYAAMQIINNTPTTTTPGLPTALLAGEKAGALGVLKTFIALDLLHVIEARSAIGAVVDMTGDVNAVLPIVSQDSVYQWISAKLDEAKAEVDSAGTAFYFPIYTGFSTGVPADGTTPAGFAQFNRAIKARVEAKRGPLGCGATCYAAALTALTTPWITDLAAVRANSGGSNGGTSVVAFAAPATDSQFVSELLLQRTLSLYQEGQRWVDYKRLNRLAELGKFPQDTLAGFTVAPYSVLP